ncbi:MAG: dienelactone hydrolase family protein [Anaerolineales bacterium]
MIEEKVQISTKDGVSNGWLIHPEGDGPWPGVIHFTDIGGIRPAQHEMARRLAGEGYCVLMPNVFYRSGEPPMFDAETRSNNELRMKRFREQGEPLTAEAEESDAETYIDFLENQDAAAKGAFGAVGYCFTGSFALRTAATRADKIAAIASFHGGGLYSDEPSSPHQVLPRVKARLYFGHAVEDRSMPSQAIDKFEQALADWGGHYESEVYDDSHHGWTVPDSPVYNQPQAERAYTKLTELFAETLK